MTCCVQCPRLIFPPSFQTCIARKKHALILHGGGQGSDSLLTSSTDFAKTKTRRKIYLEGERHQSWYYLPVGLSLFPQKLMTSPPTMIDTSHRFYNNYLHRQCVTTPTDNFNYIGLGLGLLLGIADTVGVVIGFGFEQGWRER